jgi:hypothetical protein
MKHNQRRYSWAERLILFVGLIAAGFFYAGFYYPDPNASRSMGRVSFMVIFWGARIGVPVAVVGFMLLYHGVKTGRISPANMMLMGISILVCTGVAYPAASFFYYRSSGIGEKISEYHPYLQLAPREMGIRNNDSRGEAITVMCLGGSTTEFRDSRGKGWTDRLEEKLNERYPTRKIHVFNVGRQWYTTLHMLIHYETNLRQYRPDVLIVMEAINDLLHNADFSYLSFKPFRGDYGHFYGPMKGVMARKTFEGSLFFKFRSFWYHHPREQINQLQFQGIVAYERNLNTLMDLAQLDKTDVVLMTQPNIFKKQMTATETAALDMVHFEAIGARSQWSVESARLGMEAYNGAMRSISGKRQAHLIDLEKKIPKTLEYFFDDVHYRDIGFDLVADAVFEGLEHSGIIDQKIKSAENKRN